MNGWPVTDVDAVRDDDQLYMRAEVAGPIDEMLERLSMLDASSERSGHGDFTQIIEDISALLVAIDRLDGGIRSQLAAEAGLEMSSWSVRGMLELLREYGFVELEKNTWTRGPEFPEDVRDTVSGST
jgi:hypothetical protein